MSGRGDFWSRRRAAVRAEEQAQAEALLQQQQAHEQAVQEREQAEKTDEEILAELNLPDPDTMERGADFAAFMSKAVPERLRRRALRRLWVSDPVLANLDNLVDYADDYTDAATCVENLQTSYQVGRGMLAHIEAVEAQAKAKAEAAEAALADDQLADAADTADDAATPSSSLRLPEAGSRTAAHGSEENARARGQESDARTDSGDMSRDAAAPDGTEDGVARPDDAEVPTQTFDETANADRLVPAGPASATSGRGDATTGDTQDSMADRQSAPASTSDAPRAQPRRHMRFAFAGQDGMTGAQASKGK